MRYALRGVSALLFVCLVSLCTAQNEPQNTQQCVAAEAEQCSGNEAVKDTWEHWVSDVSRRFAKGGKVLQLWLPGLLQKIIVCSCSSKRGCDDCVAR